MVCGVCVGVDIARSNEHRWSDETLSAPFLSPTISRLNLIKWYNIVDVYCWMAYAYVDVPSSVVCVFMCI